MRMKPWTQDEASQLIALWTSNHSMSECAKELSRSRSSIAGKLRDMNLFGFGGKFTPKKYRFFSTPEHELANPPFGVAV